MATPFLAIDSVGATPTVRRYTNATRSTVGVSVGTADVGGTDTPKFRLSRRVVQFGGAETWLVALGNQIYRTTDGGASWASVYTLPSIIAQNIEKTGLHIVPVSGVPTVVCLYRTNTVTYQWRAAQSTNGTSWTDSTLTTVSGPGSADAIKDELVFHGLLYAVSGGAGVGLGLSIYNPATLGHTGVDFTDESANPLGVLVEFNNALLFAYANGSGAIVLKEIIGTAQFTRATLRASGYVGDGTAHQLWAAFVDGANLYCFTYGATGFECFQVSSTYTVTDISGTVLPTALSTCAATGRLTTFVDAEASPGSSPTKNLLFAANGNIGTVPALYQWNGNAAVMTLIDSGNGSAQDALGVTNGSTGAYNHAAGENHIEIVSRTAVANGIRWSFKCFSPSGTATVSARFWRAGASEEHPVTRATLSSPSAGTLGGPGGNTEISSLTADNTTIYQVTFLSVGDGVGQGTRYQAVPEIF